VATAEIAPVVWSATQGPAGVNVLREPEFAVNPSSQATAVVLPVSPETIFPGIGRTIEIEVEARGATLSVKLLDEPPSARPIGSVLFAGTLGPDLRLVKPIPLQVSDDEGRVVLTWAETDDFACGQNTGEALDSFGRSIRELYDYLHAHDVVLGADLLRVRDILDRYIAPRPRR